MYYQWNLFIHTWHYKNTTSALHTNCYRHIEKLNWIPVSLQKSVIISKFYLSSNDALNNILKENAFLQHSPSYSYLFYFNPSFTESKKFAALVNRKKSKVIEGTQFKR